MVVCLALEMDDMALSLSVCGSGMDSRRAVRPRENAFGRGVRRWFVYGTTLRGGDLDVFCEALVGLFEV